jgi:hypothetical protein
MGAESEPESVTIAERACARLLTNHASLSLSRATQVPTSVLHFLSHAAAAMSFVIATCPPVARPRVALAAKRAPARRVVRVRASEEVSAHSPNAVLTPVVPMLGTSTAPCAAVLMARTADEHALQSL